MSEKDQAQTTAEQEENGDIGKYGGMRLRYLQNHQRKLYRELKQNGTLREHLLETDRRATEQIDRIVQHMAKAEGTDEALKARDPMSWVGLMNNYRHCAEEIVLPMTVYE